MPPPPTSCGSGTTSCKLALPARLARLHPVGLRSSWLPCVRFPDIPVQDSTRPGRLPPPGCGSSRRPASGLPGHLARSAPRRSSPAPARLPACRLALAGSTRLRDSAGSASDPARRLRCRAASQPSASAATHPPAGRASQPPQRPAPADCSGSEKKIKEKRKKASRKKSQTPAAEKKDCCLWRKVRTDALPTARAGEASGC